MKALVLVDIPEDDSLFILSPFLTKVTLDYGNKVLEVYGDVRAIPKRKSLRNHLPQYDTDTHYEQGYNACLDDILVDDVLI